MNNSWFNNATSFRKGKERENPLHMNRVDVERLGLFDVDAIVMSTEFGSLNAHVFVDDTLRENVVAMAHG